MDYAARDCDVGKLAAALECAVVNAHNAVGNGVPAFLCRGALAEYLTLVGEENAVLDIEPGIRLVDDEGVQRFA